MPRSLNEINSLIREASKTAYRGPWEAHTEHDGATGCFAILLLNKDVMSVSNDVLQQDEHGPYILFKHNTNDAPNSCGCVDFSYLQVPRSAFVLANEMVRGAAHLLSAQWASAGCIYNMWTHYRCIWANLAMHAISPTGRPSRLRARIPDWNTKTVWPQHVAELVFLKLWQQADLGSTTSRGPATKPESGVPLRDIQVINATTRFRVDEIRLLRARKLERAARGQETDYLLWFATQVKPQPTSSSPSDSTTTATPNLNPSPNPAVRIANCSNSPALRRAESWNVPSTKTSRTGHHQLPASEIKRTGRQRPSLSTTSGSGFLRSGDSRPGRPKTQLVSGTCDTKEKKSSDPVSLDVLAAVLRDENARKYPVKAQKRVKANPKPLVIKPFREPANWKNLTPSSRRALNEVAKVYPNVDPAFYPGFLKSQGLEKIRQKAKERAETDLKTPTTTLEDQVARARLRLYV